MAFSLYNLLFGSPRIHVDYSGPATNIISSRIVRIRKVIQ